MEQLESTDARRLDSSLSTNIEEGGIVLNGGGCEEHMQERCFWEAVDWQRGQRGGLGVLVMGKTGTGDGDIAVSGFMQITRGVPGCFSAGNPKMLLAGGEASAR